ncbi:hypothetical protein ACTFIV_005192 [Dictyostelium citrinum]
MEFKYRFNKPINYTSAGSIVNKEYNDGANEINHDNDKPILFSQLKIKNLKLKNRIVVSTMCQYSSLDAEPILQSNSSDLIMFGRAFLRNPFLPIEFVHQLKLKIDYTLQYQPSRIRYIN